MCSNQDRRLRRVSLVQYSFTNETGEKTYEPGVFLTKETSSDTFWTVQSLLAKDQVEMCWICAQRLQRPVRHSCGVDATCIVTQSRAAETDLLSIDKTNIPVPPTPVPLFGEALTAAVEKHNALPTPRSGPAATRRKPIGQFPCKLYYQGCTEVYYKTAAGANKHMLAVHGKAMESEGLTPYPRSDRTRKVNAKERVTRKRKEPPVREGKKPVIQASESDSDEEMSDGWESKCLKSPGRKRKQAAPPATGSDSEAEFTQVMDALADPDPNACASPVAASSADEDSRASSPAKSPSKQEETKITIEIVAIKSQHEGRSFHLLQRKSDQGKREGHFLGTEAIGDHLDAVYKLSWLVDDSDAEDEIGEVLSASAPYASHRGVEPFNKSWTKQDELARGLTLTREGKLDKRSREALTTALQLPKVKVTAKVESDAMQQVAQPPPKPQSEQQPSKAPQPPLSEQQAQLQAPKTSGNTEAQEIERIANRMRDPDDPWHVKGAGPDTLMYARLVGGFTLWELARAKLGDSKESGQGGRRRR